MKKLFAILMAVCMLAGICALPTFAADEAVVYLKAGGTGDGSSEANATGTLADAMAAAAAKTTDAKIQVVGEVEVDITNYFHSPVHKNKITITGKDTSGKLKFDTTVANNSIWYLNGTLAFENLEFFLTVNNLHFYAEFNNIYFLEGITVNDTNNADKRIGVRGVGASTEKTFDGFQYNANQKMVFLSGKFLDIAPFAQNGTKGNLNGKVTLYFGGTALTNNIVATRNAWGSASNVTFIFDGGTVERFVGYTDRSKSAMDTKGMTIGATETFTIIVTDKFDPTQSFTISTDGVYQGFSGSTIHTEGAKDIVTGAYVGDYQIKAETQAYDKLGTTYVNADSFDGAMTKIASGSGVPADIMADDDDPAVNESVQQPDEPATPSGSTSTNANNTNNAPTTSKNPIKQTSKVTENATDAATTEAPAEEAPNNTTTIIIIAAVAVAVVVTVVVVIVVTKKKA